MHLIWAFLNSVFITAIVGSMAGAGAGAYGAQWIVARGRQREELLTEIRNTNATIMIAVGLCNSFLGIKRQNVKPLKDLYDAQKAAYHDHAKTDFVADLRSLYLPPFPLEILRQQAFDKLSLSGRPLLLINALGETIHGLNTSINARNDLIASYKQNSTFSTELYFGLRQDSVRVINQEYPASIEMIYRHTDDGIFFSHLLSTDLFAHGKQLANRFKTIVGQGAPDILNKPDFTEVSDLMPTIDNYVNWFCVVRKAKPSTKIGGRSRYNVLTIPSLLYNRALRWIKLSK